MARSDLKPIAKHQDFVAEEGSIGGQFQSGSEDQPRPYKCPICYKGFTHLEHQVRHSRVHDPPAGEEMARFRSEWFPSTTLPPAPQLRRSASASAFVTSSPFSSDANVHAPDSTPFANTEFNGRAKESYGELLEPKSLGDEGPSQDSQNPHVTQGDGDDSGGDTINIYDEDKLTIGGAKVHTGQGGTIQFLRREKIKDSTETRESVHTSHIHTSSGSRLDRPLPDPSDGPHEIWYCCYCGLYGDGALSTVLHGHCTNCGYQRCENCTTEWPGKTVGVDTYIDDDVRPLRSSSTHMDSGYFSNTPSMSSGNSILEPATTQISRTLMSDVSLQNMLLEAAHRVPQQKLIRNIKRLLQYYHDNPQRNIVDNEQRLVATVIGKHTKSCAQKLCHLANPRELAVNSEQDPDRREILERYLIMALIPMGR